MWKYRGNERPSFAIEPGPGQESVWDYPRPPAVETSDETVEVHSGERIIARTTRAVRVLETASPPTYYLPLDDVDASILVAVQGRSFCEWKGAAHYLALQDNPGVPVAWGYRSPALRFAALAEHVSFYPGRVACLVDEEPVRPQPGGFYGGWLTDRIAGPVKGEPGTGHW